MMKYENENGDILTIEYDCDCENPREFCNIGKFCVPERCKYIDSEMDFYDFESMDKRKMEREYLFVPVYVYEHGGIAMNITGFSCPWDSGQIGYYVVTKEDIRREYDCKRITKSIREKVINCIKSEVELYAKYLNGECYYYNIEDAEGNFIDGCGGFFSIEDILNEHPDFTEVA